MYQLFPAVIFLVILRQTEAVYGTNPTDGWDGMPTIGFDAQGRQTFYPNVSYDQLTSSTCPYNPHQPLHTSQDQQYPPHQSQHPTPPYQPPYQPPANTVPVFNGDDIGFEKVTDTRGGVPSDAFSFNNFTLFVSSMVGKDDNERKLIDNAMKTVKNAHKIDPQNQDPQIATKHATDVGGHMWSLTRQLRQQVAAIPAHTAVNTIPGQHNPLDSMPLLTLAGQIFYLANAINPRKKPAHLQQIYRTQANYQIDEGYSNLRELLAYIDHTFGACKGAKLHALLELAYNAAYGQDVNRNLITGIINQHLHQNPQNPQKPNLTGAFLTIFSRVADYISPQASQAPQNSVWMPPTVGGPQHGQPGHQCTTAACQALDYTANQYMNSYN